MENQNQEFFKVLSSQSIKNHQKPTLGNYNSILQTLKNCNYLYVDFNKNEQDSLILLEKTHSPLKHHPEDLDDDDIHDNGAHDFEALGNQFILDMNNLSKHSYKMMRYVSEGKKIMKKRRNIDELESSFIKEIQEKVVGENKNKINFGPKYRKIEEKNKKLHFSSKIEPEKLEEYLENKNYRKIERKLEKSEQELGRYVTNVKELKEKSLESSRVMEKKDSAELKKIESTELTQTSFNKNILGNHRSYSLTKSESENLQRINKELQSRIKFPKIQKLSKILAQSFTER